MWEIINQLSNFMIQWMHNLIKFLTKLSKQKAEDLIEFLVNFAIISKAFLCCFGSLNSILARIETKIPSKARALIFLRIPEPPTSVPVPDQ